MSVLSAQAGADYIRISQREVFSQGNTSLRVLFHNPFLQILRQIHLPDIRCCIISGDFCHIVLDHKLNQLFESSGLRVPAEFGLGFGRVTPEVYDVCRAIEVFGNGDNSAADKVCVGRA